MSCTRSHRREVVFVMLQVLLLLGDGLERLGLLFFVVRASREFGVVHVGFFLG